MVLVLQNVFFLWNQTELIIITVNL